MSASERDRRTEVFDGVPGGVESIEESKIGGGVVCPGLESITEADDSVKPSPTKEQQLSIGSSRLEYFWTNLVFANFVLVSDCINAKSIPRFVLSSPRLEVLGERVPTEEAGCVSLLSSLSVRLAEASNEIETGLGDILRRRLGLGGGIIIASRSSASTVGFVNTNSPSLSSERESSQFWAAMRAFEAMI